MSGLFITILNMSIAGSFVILVILLARLILKNAPKKWSYLLWIAAGFRLCCPVSIRSAISLFRVMPKTASRSTAKSIAALEYIPRTTAQSVSAPAIAQPVVGGAIPDPAIPMLSSAPTAAQTAVPAAENVRAAAETAENAPADVMSIVLTVLAAVWLAGVASMLAYALVDYIRLRKRTATATLLEGNVYQSENITSPFVLGVLKPRIIVPYGLNEKELEYVLAHERYHLRRGDQIIKFFSFLLLCLHWFNPLCWLAFILMNRDMEMSCDEKVLGSIGSKAGYSSALLSFAAGKRFAAPNPLSFSETNVKGRVKNVMKFKKPKLIVTIAAVALCIVIVAACVVNPKDEGPKDAADATGEPAAEATPTPEPETTPDPVSEASPEPTAAPTDMPAGSITAYWPVDIDGDGAEDKLAIDLTVLFTERYEAPYIVLADGTEVTGFEKISPAHAGVGTYAIAERDGRQYVLEHHIQSYSGGHVTDRYVLWTLENGSLAAAETDAIEYNFAYSMDRNTNDVGAVIAYYDKLNEICSTARIAISVDPFITCNWLFRDGDLSKPLAAGGNTLDCVLSGNLEAIHEAVDETGNPDYYGLMAYDGTIRYLFDLGQELDGVLGGESGYDRGWDLEEKLRFNNHVIERYWDYVEIMLYLGYEDASGIELIDESRDEAGVWTYIFRDSATGRAYFIIGGDASTITEISWTFE